MTSARTMSFDQPPLQPGRDSDGGHEHLGVGPPAPRAGRPASATSGRVCAGRGQPSDWLTIVRTWRRAREAVFTDDVYTSPLAKTPYDLRHAAVSTWLNGGVSPTTAAAWAGHSVEILLKIYAKCLDGEGAAVRRRVEAALGH